MATLDGHPGRSNEDFVGVVPNGAVLVDGAGVPNAGHLCRHGVAWYAHRLGGALLAALPQEPERPLAAILTDAITTITDLHRDSCEVTNASSPFAAVAILRAGPDRVEHLVLGDACAVLAMRDGSLLVTEDRREAEVMGRFEGRLAAAPEGGEAYRAVLDEMRACRNAPGGYWVAKDDPVAAAHGFTGSAAAQEVASAALLSNGAARLVVPFAVADWAEVMTVLDTAGPAALIERVRAEETRREYATDDATAVHCTAFQGR
ncbi:hypothetical protein E9998_20495 [Glycomyces paridis]|uniref:PPM-type phosphatase domain-containing protein n=2 Tax=Glycomyces paridis TaxID=2126555 RepID=A0A4S8P3Q5_9ACTN|nr:hypothetical protein E9998_20495 [Glycomyces paridis]